MKKTSYTALQRRAANQVWNAAEEYDFEPLFLSARTQGSVSDFYMNLLVGLAYKYYGENTIRNLFDRWSGDARQDMLDDLTWLYLEQVLYMQEAPLRPAMAEIRAAYAEDFFIREGKLSKQEFMNKNSLVDDIQNARWKSVLNKKKLLKG